jgi:cytochrome c-type biogenesis protein CcmH
MTRVYQFIFIAAAMAVLVMAFTSAAFAQDAPPDEVTADDVNLVARELWCPLCSGVRLDSCELKACDQMKDVIAIKLAEGEDTESIKAYFVDQYGPQVLGEPPREGFNWLAWILPVVAVAFGGIFVWRQMGRMMRTPAKQEAGDSTEPNAETTVPEQGDEYDRKLEEELTRYG